MDAISIAMTVTSLLGTFIIGFSMLPQTIATFKTRQTANISLGLYFLMGVATLFITFYGIGLCCVPLNIKEVSSQPMFNDYNWLIDVDRQGVILGYIVPGAAIIFGELFCSVTSFMIAILKIINQIGAKKMNMTEAEYIEYINSQRGMSKQLAYQEPEKVIVEEITYYEEITPKYAPQSEIAINNNKKVYQPEVSNQTSIVKLLQEGKATQAYELKTSHDDYFPEGFDFSNLPTPTQQPKPAVAQPVEPVQIVQPIQPKPVEPVKEEKPVVVENNFFKTSSNWGKKSAEEIAKRENEVISVAKQSELSNDIKELTIMISLSRSEAAKIIEEDKSVLFFKRLPVKPVKRVIVYLVKSDLNPGLVIGEFDILKTSSCSKTKAWDEFGNNSTLKRSEFNEYYEGCKKVQAMVIDDFIQYSKPKDLKSYGMKKGPAGFTYLH